MKQVSDSGITALQSSVSRAVSIQTTFKPCTIEPWILMGLEGVLRTALALFACSFFLSFLGCCERRAGGGGSVCVCVWGGDTCFDGYEKALSFQLPRLYKAGLS